uniref:Filamin-B n=1 Tax=Syphacia muris TaxID=451379 RepID=A0A0N5ABV1_9BILA
MIVELVTLNSTIKTRIRIYCQGTELSSSPISLQVLSGSPPPRVPSHKPVGALSALTEQNMDCSGSSASGIGHVSFSGLSEPCSIGSIVEVVINAHGDSALGSVRVESVSPSGRVKKCEVIQKGNLFTATFAPNEVAQSSVANYSVTSGEWQIGILYDNEHIRGSPFACNVYDSNLVQVYGLDIGLVGQQLKFSVNSSQAGEGVVKVSVMRLGRTIPCDVIEQASSGVHRVSFTPDGAGQYKIHVLFNNTEVKGSPFILDIADASSVSVFGENLRMASVDRLSTFMIHATGADCKDITVTITGLCYCYFRLASMLTDKNILIIQCTNCLCLVGFFALSTTETVTDLINVKYG